MDDTTTTFIGRVATKVEGTILPGGAYKATFRLASSERRFDRATGEWRDGRSLFMTVVAWRKLAEHAVLSLQVGDPVIARGRIFSREYEKDGRTQDVVEMEASALGPDLTWCTANVSRRTRANEAPASTGDGFPEELDRELDGELGTGEPEGGEMEGIERGIRAHEAAVGV